jgi:4-amino-4-deoxy-L-arabinose transferase-like glycosyltransferase
MPADPNPSPARREQMPKPMLTVLIVILAMTGVYLLFFFRLDALGLTGPDEPRYAEVAKEMFLSRDYVTPRLLGQPWYEKPILYYWCTAFAFSRMGINETAARLPSAVSTLLLAACLFFATRRLFRLDARVCIATVFSTTLAIVAFSHAASTDMLFTATFSITMILFFTALTGPDSPASRFQLFLAYATLGLSALAKGPLGVLLASLILSVFHMAGGRRREVSRIRFLPGIAILALVAAPWYLLCAYANGWSFIHTFLIQHNVMRFATNQFQHAQPFWFFVPTVLIGFLPWSFFLILPARHIRKVLEKDYWQEHPQTLFLILWIAIPFLFFTLAQSKLPGYILPVFVPLSILLGKTLADVRNPQTGKVQPILGLALWQWASLFEVIFFVFLYFARHHLAAAIRPSFAGLAEWICWTSCMAIVLIVISSFLRRNLQLTILMNAAYIIVIVLLSTQLLLPGIDAELSVRPATQLIHQLSPRPAVFTARASRSIRYGLDFYMTPPPTHGISISDIEKWRSGGTAFLIMPAESNPLPPHGMQSFYESTLMRVFRTVQ